MQNSVSALNLPLQYFALGSAIGMASALVHHLRTGRVDHWPVHIAVPAVGLFLLGILQTIVFAVAS